MHYLLGIVVWMGQYCVCVCVCVRERVHVLESGSIPLRSRVEKHQAWKAGNKTGTTLSPPALSHSLSLSVGKQISGGEREPCH